MKASSKNKWAGRPLRLRTKIKTKRKRKEDAVEAKTSEPFPLEMFISLFSIFPFTLWFLLTLNLMNLVISQTMIKTSKKFTEIKLHYHQFKHLKAWFHLDSCWYPLMRQSCRKMANFFSSIFLTASELKGGTKKVCPFLSHTSASYTNWLFLSS